MAAAIVLAAAATAARQDPPRAIGGFETTRNYRLAIIAAEDNRIRLPQGLHTPILDAMRLRMVEDVRILLKLAHSGDREAQRLAIRAIGRYESREFITDLLPFVTTGLGSDAIDAIVRSFRGPSHPSDRGGEQMQGFMDLLISAASRDDGYVGTAAKALGELPYDRPEQAHAAEVHLRNLLRRAEANPRVSIAAVVSGIESFARISRQHAPLSAATIERLREIAVSGDPRRAAASTEAFAALVASGGVDAETLKVTAVDSQSPRKRYVSAMVLGGTAAIAADFERVYLLEKLLQDPEVSIRIEAVKAWARRVTPIEGCDLLIEALRDSNPHVMLTALDALGTACPQDENITDRLTIESRTPGEAWHRPTRALVALAKRAPERVTIPLHAAFISHPRWQVRMYAARVASMLKDMTALERLAVDREDNVREAVLASLRAARGAESDRYFVDALGRQDYQLLRTAANELKGAAPTLELADALLRALIRVTADRKETSRDTRLALIDRLAELGNAEQAEHVAPLLRDFDIPVAQAAAVLLQQWTGKPQEVVPQPLPRPPLPTLEELHEDVDAVIEMQSGKEFAIRFLSSEAPLNATRFKRLARAGYYNDLTFHRIVPNFVIQGGSPGANEYVGDGPFVHDEIGAPHAPFSVGLSTRGRDTGDAQFFVNLVDNRRLNPDYTVFAQVCELTRPGTTRPGKGREAVESILEGDRITRIKFEKWDACR